jgi:hypothetical protein
MPYNRDIKSLAPLPSGALPTDDQIASVISKASQARAEFLVRGLRRFLHQGR